MAQTERPEGRADPTGGDAIDRVETALRQIDELEPRLDAPPPDEVALSLLERATELVEEAGRRLEHLGDVGA